MKWQRGRLKPDWLGFMNLKPMVAYRRSIIGTSFGNTYWVTDGHVLIQIAEECGGVNLSRMVRKLPEPIDQKKMNKRARSLKRKNND